VGVALAMPAGSVFAAGSKEIVQVTLRAAANTTGTVAVTFADQPVPREVSDVLANPLSTAYVTSNVVIHPPPSLRIGRVDQGITLAWPLWATNFVLQVAEGALPLSNTWTNLPVTPNLGGGECMVNLPMGDAAKFYRLLQP
jgi:hypothetical protein